MSATVTRLAVALGAVTTIACGGRDLAENDTNPPAVIAPGEAVGTSGTTNQLITLSGCLAKAEPDGYVLTSIDETILRQETGTAGHHRDDEGSTPEEPNRSAEDERLRHEQNPSAELGRYRLEGDAERLAMLVDREVQVQGRVQNTDAMNETAASLAVETIDATGPRCSGE
jgi:hypothetical protein